MPTTLESPTTRTHRELGEPESTERPPCPQVCWRPVGITKLDGRGFGAWVYVKSANHCGHTFDARARRWVWRRPSKAS
jgi:hypothetical protein